MQFIQYAAVQKFVFWTLIVEPCKTYYCGYQKCHESFMGAASDSFWTFSNRYDPCCSKTLPEDSPVWFVDSGLSYKRRIQDQRLGYRGEAVEVCGFTSGEPGDSFFFYLLRIQLGFWLIMFAVILLTLLCNAVTGASNDY